MKTKPLVLIVEDEESIRSFVSIVLAKSNYRVAHAKTGKEGIFMAATYDPDVILLDLGLPDIDGMEVLKNIRERSDTPVIIDTARGNERDQVVALDMGANDYITKPFTTGELLARIGTAIRSNSIGGIEKAVIGELQIDYGKQEVFLSGQIIRLTPIEYKLLALLSKNAGRILTYDFICREIWGSNVDAQQTLCVNMANVRRKIESNPGAPKYILAEIGVGYRMINGSSA